MGGPTTAVEAARWIKVAVAEFRTFADPGGHLHQRLAERGFDMMDVQSVLKRCRPADIEPYTNRPPSNGGSNWRVKGRALDEEERKIAVGVELFRFEAERCCMVITVFEFGQEA
jgi:hypothetical protein